MPKFQPFPLCCGASIITDFSQDPGNGVEFEMEQVDTQWGPTMKPKLDENGNKIPKATYADKFLEAINGHMGRSMGINDAYYAKTYRDHGVFAILSGTQLKSAAGKNWMKILVKCGFEHVRSWNNTVHGESPNHLFMLLKHTSTHEVPSPTTPPKEWLDAQKEFQESNPEKASDVKSEAEIPVVAVE